MFIMTNPQYQEGLLLDEYNGVYSLLVVTEGHDGKHYKKWAKPQTKTGEAKKPIPMGVRLGDNKQEAAKILRNFAEGILAGMQADEDDVPFDPEHDIPF